MDQGVKRAPIILSAPRMRQQLDGIASSVPTTYFVAESVQPTTGGTTGARKLTCLCRAVGTTSKVGSVAGLSSAFKYPNCVRWEEKATGKIVY